MQSLKQRHGFTYLFVFSVWCRFLLKIIDLVFWKKVKNIKITSLVFCKKQTEAVFNVNLIYEATTENCH